MLQVLIGLSFDTSFFCNQIQSHHASTLVRDAKLLNHFAALEAHVHNAGPRTDGTTLLLPFNDSAALRRNFALQSSGATILPEATSPTFGFPLRTRLLTSVVLRACIHCSLRGGLFDRHFD